MSVVRVTEITASSTKGFEDALRSGSKNCGTHHGKSDRRTIGKTENELQHRYLELQEEIRSELERSSDQRYISLASTLNDVGDNSVVDMLMDLDATIIDRQVHEMRNIETSLKKLAGLDFGNCVDCIEEIGFNRLIASPTAQRCVNC